MKIVKGIARKHVIRVLPEGFQKEEIARHASDVPKDTTKKRKREIQIRIKLYIEI